MGRRGSHASDGSQRCAVPTCENNKWPAVKDISYFRVPKDARRRTWLKAIKRKYTSKPTKLLVCELHFTSGDIVANHLRKRLATGAVPSLNLPSSYPNPSLPEAPASLDTDMPLPEVIKHEPKDYVYGPIIDLFSEGEIVVAEKRTLESTEAPGTMFSLNGIPLKRERSDAEEFPTDTYETEEGFAGPPLPSHEIPANVMESLNHSKETDLDLLIKLSKSYLSPELAKFIEVQALLKTELKANFEGRQCNKDLLLFALKLYHSFPQTYKVMQESLCLPKMLKIRQLCSNLTWEINDTWAKVVGARFERASAEERQCVVCVATARLQLGLAYEATRDRVAGLDEVDGVQRPRTARSAIVVYARGIFARWQQPLSYALLAANASPDEIWLWLDIIISKLFDLGLNVRALITDFDAKFVPTCRPIGPDKTYFQVKDKQVYCFYDCTQLIVRLRDCLMMYNINFEGMIASWEVIEELYEYDSTRRYKSGAELTSEHVRPRGAAARRPALAVQALAPRVAAALAAAVDLRVLDDSAHGTVRLITTFSTLYDILHTKELTMMAHKITPETKFLNEMLMHLERITFMDKRERRHVPEPGLLPAFRADVRAALALQERLRRAGRSSLPMRAFNNDPIHQFFERLRDDNAGKDPTGAQLVDAFRRRFVLNIMKSFSEREGNLEGFLEMASGIRDVPAEATEETKVSLVKGLIKPSHFTPLMHPRAGSACVAGFLLEQCLRAHPCCEVGRRYCKSEPGLPYTDFLETMELKFRLHFSTDCLGEGVLATVLGSLADVEFPAPCSCFPTLYLKTLYLRYRISSLVSYNNTKFTRSISRDFTVNLVRH